MKPKPLAHKCENTFRFESFNDRLQKINISSINHLKRRFDADEQDENLSFFAIALEKWQDLNCTQDYKDLRKKIGSPLGVQNLVQIVHRKSELTQILIDCLRSRDTKALDACLELVIALSRDLQSEFYEYFPVIFELLVDLTCEVEAIESIEALFVCQTFLFKYLWKFILQDIEQYFDVIKKSLISKREYVLNFSSEVFSFLLKKSKEQEKLIKLLFASLRTEPTLSKGVSRILFESVKGVNHALHSKSKTFLDIIFNEFFHSENEYLHSMMQIFLGYLMEYCTQDTFKILWGYLLLQPPNLSSDAANKISSFIEIVTSYKRCKLIHNSSLILTTLTDYQSKSDLTIEAKQATLNSIEKIFIHRDNELSLEKVNYFAKNFYTIESTISALSLDRVFAFTQNVSSCSIFDIALQKYCCKLCSDIFARAKANVDDVELKKCLRFLACLVVSKTSHAVYGGENNKFSKYSLQFDDAESLSEILFECLQKWSEDTTISMFCLIILPHLLPLSKVDRARQLITEHVLSKIEALTETSTPENRRFVGQLLNEAIVSLALLKCHKFVIDEITSERMISLVRLYPTISEFLQAFDIFLSYNKSICSPQTSPDQRLMSSLYPLLCKFFSSPYRIDRIRSLHIATLFDFTLPPASNQLSENERKNIFQICLDAELIAPDLPHYRDRLKHIRQLDCNFISCYLPQFAKPAEVIDFSTAPVYFLLGSMYENLNILWKPMLEILETHAVSTKDKRSLTDVFFEHLKQTNAYIYANRHQSEMSQNRKSVFEELFSAKCTNCLADDSFVADHYNHRILLLKAFENFVGLIEPRNKDFVSFFFDFIDTEMKSKFIYGANRNENLQKNQSGDNDDAIQQEDDTIEEDPQFESSDVKWLWKTFFTYLTVFAKFKNPKALSREPELHQMYLNMLIAPNPGLQKHSMSCIFSYNYPYLSKYKDNFTRLLDDKTFSTEIHNFILHDNEQDNVISVDDREQVLPIFFRVLYGKMLSSWGAKVHGKSRIDFLRSIILKVISSFSEDDQIKFMDLIFTSLQPFLTSPFEAIGEQIETRVSIESFFMPFKQFKSIISTLEYLIKHFGSKSVTVMRYMFKVLLVCGSVCNRLLSYENRERIKAYLVNSLKAFRTNCFKVSQYFFVHFVRYQYTTCEIDLFFAAFVNPLIPTLQSDCLSAASPLLKLFGTWSENPRYHVLLAKRLSADDSITPLLSIIQLYSHTKITTNTSSFITGIIENLLSYDNENLNGTDRDVPIEINNYGHALPQVSHYAESINERVNFGSLLLMPYIKNILERIYANYSINCVNANKRKFEFTIQEVNVLARLSFFVKDPADSVLFATLLIYSISQARRPEEDKEVFTLKTLNHLAKNILEDDFLKLLHLTFPLFTLITRPLSRRELCNFVCSLSAKNVQFKSLAKLIGEVNSYDARFAEEPDFDRRIAGFKLIMNMLNDLTESTISSLQLDFIQLLLENCAFFLNTYDDLSLKDLSSNVIVKICELLRESNQETFNRYVINLIFYKILSVGFRQPKESARHEYIEILMKAVKILSHRHEIIEQLRRLSRGDEKDDEVDFWQNIKHIQLHRRARALTRLAQDELLDSMSSRVFTNFLIPLVSSFISDTEHYAKNVPLFTAAVDSLASFLQRCSWYKYDSILSSYIYRLLNNKIDTKIAIRVISSLLGKFAFLKADDVVVIEKELNETDFQNISAEYSFIGKPTSKNIAKSDKRMQQKKKKFEKHNMKEITQSIKNEKPNEQRNDSNYDGDKNRNADDIALKEFNEEEALPEGNDEIECTGSNLENSRKIYNSLCKKLLPLLHKCLHQKSQIDYMHDLYKDQFPEDEEIQRIPIALAIVKLLRHIQPNKRLFEANLTSIFLRLCQFLQSRADSIREASRNTLVQIMQTLGTRYFATLFYEMKSLLTRGYQRHILIYTVFILLRNLSTQFVCGDMDKCLRDIIELCHQELFGNLAEEKEISQIVNKTKEAKKLKSYDIYELLAQFVSQTALSGLLDPLKEVVLEAHSHKVVKKAEGAFYKIGRGLVANRFLTAECLLTMLADVLNASMSTNVNSEEEQNSFSKIESLLQKLPTKMDSFLIPVKSLRRVHQVSKINRSSNMHVLSDFALTSLLHLLKNNRVISAEQRHIEILEPMVIQLGKLLMSANDTKVITSALNCIHTLLVKFPELASFKHTTQKMISRIFVLLHKYSGEATNENSQLVTLCFKTIAHFINTRTECKLNNEQIAVLLSYAEKDIENNSQNATIYFLLKSIITRKFVSKELHQLMEKLLVLAITTEVDHVRTHAIELSVKYLTECEIEPSRFRGKLMKLVRQLEFEVVAGRIAAITILNSVVNKLPYDDLRPLKENLFVPISSRLVNEESIECKKLISRTVSTIISRLNQEERDNLFDTFVVPWLSCDMILIQTLSSHLCSHYVKYEKDDFEVRLASCLPLVRQQLDPSRFESLTIPGDETNLIEHKNEDNLIFQHLTFILNTLKLDKAIHLLTRPKFFEDFNQIFEFINDAYLLHSHSWIRCLATQIFGQLFSLWKDPKSFSLDVDLYKNSYLFQNTEQVLFQLGKNFCLIFRDIYNCETVAEQLIKNLVYLAGLAIYNEHESTNTAANAEKTADFFDTQAQRKISLRWLINKLLFEVKFEVKNCPDKYTKRSLVFKWIAAVSVLLYGENRDKNRLVEYLPFLLPPLCREELSSLTDTVSDTVGVESGKEELRSINKQVLQLLRTQLGSELFIDHYNQARIEISHKRLERRKNRAIEMITNVDAGVKRKQRKHKRDRLAQQVSNKRRKIMGR